jgi:hypothetical protein
MPSWKTIESQCQDSATCNVGFSLDCWQSDSLVPQILNAGEEESISTFRRELVCVSIAKAEIRCSSMERGLVGVWKDLLNTYSPKDEFHTRALGLVLAPCRAQSDSFERIGFFCALEDFFSHPIVRAISLV